MSEGNGKGRDGKAPFGPHGEDCDCEIPEEEPEEEPEKDAPQIEIDHSFDERHEVVWAAAAQALAEQFLNTNLAMANEGIPLERRQTVHIVTMMMRGYALAKESAYMVEQHYAEAMAQIQAALDEEEKGDEPPNHLHDLKETFSRGPQP